ncbi:hypothetical protein FRC02_011752 [Tulasnella sp. 418]|nr:hypothetical protein FRC02_011752 [Tulasnella sp. 418]
MAVKYLPSVPTALPSICKGAVKRDRVQWYSTFYDTASTGTATVSRKAKRLNEGHNTLRRQTRFRALGYLLGGGSGSGSGGAQQQPSHPIISSPLVKHTFQHQNQSVASFDTASYSIISPSDVFENMYFQFQS